MVGGRRLFVRLEPVAPRFVLRERGFPGAADGRRKVLAVGGIRRKSCPDRDDVITVRINHDGAVSRVRRRQIETPRPAPSTAAGVNPGHRPRHGTRRQVRGGSAAGGSRIVEVDVAGPGDHPWAGGLKGPLNVPTNGAARSAAAGCTRPTANAPRAGRAPRPIPLSSATTRTRAIASQKPLLNQASRRIAVPT